MSGVAYGTGREALLDAAIHVVASHGLRGLTYRSVAAHAGVTHGAVRYHFGSWANLVEEALAWSVQRSIGDSALYAGDGRGLDGFATGLGLFVAENPHVQAFQYELALESRRRPELAEPMERVYDAYRAAVRDALIQVDIDDEDLTDLVFAAIDGIIFRQTAFGNPERTERTVSALRQVLGVFRDHLTTTS
ncbi:MULTISPECIES: TetR/AcrR family transcriptional regulator [unclassified Rhodococcus (in: high G+C Gram-positive bacteria)]|jgi:AcrR family transcriptional regulator|uniref:TetR/AcrR family transcriptional regulator n=1 Tax=unclassified Rhodococcus (in: high G+C Gram-positive bacteria) TaxID=192944 RepID=UPI00035EC399|nr:TetR/AcrR family transcriptional regulator [Rhodococcus sp. DK17]